MPVDETDIAPQRVLIVEDSDLDRLWLRARLAPENLDLSEASDGLRGLALCRSSPPDLVLLDLGLPFCDGFETLRILKEDSRTRSIPVIVISASWETAAKERALDLGATDFVTKPYEGTELRARVRAALRTKRHQDLLERRAHLDGLTGLANRLALDERLNVEWALHTRYHNPLSLLIVDLDHFKRVNDAHGHTVGDAVLRHAGALLRSSIRTSDLASRYGGEEFVVVAPYCDLAGAERTAERFRERLANSPLILNEGTVSVTASLGVASVPEDTAASPAELLALADRALYRAKSSGRNTVRGRFVSPEHGETTIYPRLFAKPG